MLFRSANFLTTYCVQELPENEPANISATIECTSVEDRALETNSRAAVSRLIHICFHLLTHICIQEPAENERAIFSAMEERTSVELEDGDMETNSKAAVRGFISYLI